MSNAGTILQQAADALRSAKYAVVFTGAGISTPSGIPDFQSKNTGLWQRFDPMEVASIDAFRNRPDRFFGWLRPLLKEIWSAQPNPAHIIIAQLEAAGIVKAVITQNIDDLHQRAGSKKILGIHGSLQTMTCPGCKETLPALYYQETLKEEKDHPACPHCGRTVKPDIVLYGEMLPAETWQKAELHCKVADLILVVGSSLTVYPAAALPEIGVENGAQLIIINLTPTHLDNYASVVIRDSAAEALPKIARSIL